MSEPVGLSESIFNGLRDRIIELEATIGRQRAALLEAAVLVEGQVACETQYDRPDDDPHWQAAQRWRKLADEAR